MRFSKKELELMRNQLEAKKAYRYTTLPCSAVIWEPYMETLLTKLNDELEVLS